MGVIATSFGIAAVAAMAVSQFAGSRHPSRAVAVMLLAFWAVANMTPAWVDPVMDTVGFYVALSICFARPQHRWCWVIVGAFTIQLFIHPMFGGNAHSHLRMFALNVLFAVQLLAVSIPGGIIGIRRCRDRWARSDDARPLPDPARCSTTETEPAAKASGALKVAAPPPPGR